MKFVGTFTWIICAVLLLGCQAEDPSQKLKSEVESLFASEEGTFALAFKDLETEETFFINEKERFHAASTMKTPVMIEVYKQVAAGKFQLGDSILVKNEFYSIVDSSTYQLSVGDDSEEELYQMVGTKRTLADLVYDMIIVSSNLATNLVIELVDAKKVTQTMREMGAMDIEVLRGVEDIKAYEQGLSNSTTAYDLMLIFEQLGQGKVVSAEASQAMVDILLDQRFNEIIPALLPEEVKVAHKTGVITALHHDSGLVILPDGRKYALVLLSKELGDFDSGTQLMAKVSKVVYDYVQAKGN